MKKIVLIFLSLFICTIAIAQEFWIPQNGSGSGSGDTTGAASSTDNAIVRFDGTTGKTIQNSQPTIDDSGDIVMGDLDTVDGRDISVDGTKLDGLPSNAISTVGCESASQTQQARINFISGTGTTVSCANNNGTTSTDITLNDPLTTSKQTGTLNTTNGTATNVGTAFTIPSGLNTVIKVLITGRLTSNDGSYIRYERELMYENTAGTVTNRINGTPLADFEATTPTNISAAIFPAPVISSNTVQIQVTGVAATNLTWTYWMTAQNGL